MVNNTQYRELIKKRPGFLVEKILTEIVTKEHVDVSFEDDDAPWAVVKVHDYDEDNEMSLRLLTDNKWILQFGYYDDKDEFNELLEPLAQPEIDLIPLGLRKVMLRVLSAEEGLRVPGNLLSA